MDEEKIIIKALLELNKQGQLCPDTIKELEDITKPEVKRQNYSGYHGW